MKSYIGGIAGYSNAVNIQVCVNNADITGYSNVGGIAGYVNVGSSAADYSVYITRCANYGDISGTAVSMHIGGIAG